MEFLISAKNEGKSVVAYGAAAKGNTLLNYCGVRNDFIDYAVDRSPHKQGLFLPGCHIEVCAPDRIKQTRPDYLLILPWNIKEEVIDQCAFIREWGGKFVVPIPGSASSREMNGTGIDGAFVIDIERKEDERGFFARSFCVDEYKVLGLNSKVVQTSISFNHRRGTLRGMHYQCRPHGEAKLVRCVSGAIYDVIVDLRVGSSTAKQWCAVELSAANYRMIYIPEGCAHGFQTLEDNSELHYQMSEFFHPECSRGFHWRDSQFDIPWPVEDAIVSQKDQDLAAFQDSEMF